MPSSYGDNIEKVEICEFYWLSLCDSVEARFPQKMAADRDLETYSNHMFHIR